MTARKRQNMAALIFRRLVLSWLAAVTAEYLLLGREDRALSGLEGLARMSLGRVLTVTAVCFMCLWLLAVLLRGKLPERWVMAALFGVLGAASLLSSFSWPFFALCCLIFLGMTVYALWGWDRSRKPPEAEPGHKGFVWVLAVVTGLFFILVSAWTVGRVYSFSSPTFDFGIFSQMFHSMRTSGLPVTTVERDGALSHFDVHVSPVYYLLLPFYALVPTPATLQVLQAAVIASSVIPLWKLGRLHGLSGLQRFLVCAVLLLLPAFSGGTGYDIHENCFLTPLLLWLFYAMDRKIPWLTAIFALLTLSVKEDAAVYVAVAALYETVRSLLSGQYRGVMMGAVMLIGAVGWFLGVTAYLANGGDGVMTYRYSNFMYDGSGSLLTVVKAVLVCPMKAVYECVDTEKLYYIAMTLLPLLGLPLVTRRFERYILLIPYILVNLMSDYRYQHDLFFQYSFGSTACLVYLTAVNLADLRVSWQRLSVLIAAAAVSAVCFFSVVFPTAVYYPAQSIRYYGYYQNIRDTLSLVPEGASVSATTFYTTFLSRRDVLYDIRYASREHILSTEYIVMNVKSESCFEKYARGGKNGYENFVKLLEANGYVLFARIEDTLAIYYRP